MNKKFTSRNTAGICSYIKIIQTILVLHLLVPPPSKPDRDPRNCWNIAACCCCALSRHCFITSTILSPCSFILLHAALKACFSSSSSLSTSFIPLLTLLFLALRCCAGVAGEREESFPVAADFGDSTSGGFVSAPHPGVYLT